MKTFKASKLKTHTAEVFAAAREDGAIIQQLRTNGEVIEEFYLIKADGESIFNLYKEHESKPLKVI